MADWVVKDILDHIQDLIGEPVGSFYNLSTRLRQLNQAQRELVQDTRALTATATIPTVVGQAAYSLPSDFLTYGKEQPYYSDSTTSAHKLQVVDVSWMDQEMPYWRSSTLSPASTPRYIVDMGQMTYELYPVPGQAGDVVIPYVVEPDELSALEDEVFNGYENMNRYALALAYKVAAVHMLPRAPQLGQQYLGMYNRELRQMRHDLRVNPQKQAALRPFNYVRRYRRN